MCYSCFVVTSTTRSFGQILYFTTYRITFLLSLFIFGLDKNSNYGQNESNMVITSVIVNRRVRAMISYDL